MLSLTDAAALSVWPGVRRARLAEFLHAIAAPACTPAAPAAGSSPSDCGFPFSPTLEAALDFAGASNVGSLAVTLHENGDRALALAARGGVVAIAWGDPRYPPLLASIHDPPVVLWVKGRVEALSGPAVALVGSRSASPPGLEAATRLAADLAARGLLVVSGLARGIDAASHHGALQAGGETIAVLGSGPDVIYPAAHGELAAAIAEAGAIVSELAPGTPPRSLHFPARNRIISGLSLATVVVEAAERSGSLITADFAIEQGREALAVPGSILSGRYRGCHALIRDGAGLVEDVDDVLAVLPADAIRSLAGQPEGTSEGGQLLGLMLEGEPYGVDLLARQSGLPAPALLSRLLELELRGKVRRVDGSRFVRVSRTC